MKAFSKRHAGTTMGLAFCSLMLVAATSINVHAQQLTPETGLAESKSTTEPAVEKSVPAETEQVKPTEQVSQGSPAVNADPMVALVKQREDELIKSVYAQTQTARTASEFTKLIDDCRRGQTLKISAKNQKYLQSLTGWALNRRGGKRLDLSIELRAIRNYDSANEMLGLAESDFQESLELKAHNWRPQVALAICSAERGEYLTAIEKFNVVCNQHPKQAEPRFNKAELYYALERYEHALAAYDEVIKLNASDLQAITGRAHCLLKLDRVEEAAKEYEVVTRMVPTNPWANINLADCQQALGNWQQAYDSYFQAMKSKPIGEGYQKTAWMLATCPDVEFNRPQMAFTLAKKAIELSGETVLNMETMAAAHAASGDFDIAKKMLESAIILDGGTNQTFTDRIAMYDNQVPYLQKPLGESESPERVAELPAETDTQKK